MSGRIVSVNVSRQKGTGKQAAGAVVIGPRGLEGDAHAGAWHRQVSLLALESIRRFEAESGRPVAAGAFAENLTTEGVALERAGVLDRLRAGAALLEVTQLGKTCHGDGCAIFREVGRCVMPREGVFCRVLEPGAVQPGDPIELLARPLRITVVTVSDRASRGEYEDLAGPELARVAQEHLAGRRYHPAVSRVVVPDEEPALEAALRAALEAGADLVFTTGGTGIGPRDITPEVVLRLAEKTLPGVMEMIRVKHGARLPAALLSRSVAAVRGRALLFALPGSPKAVGEYLADLLPVVDHAIPMLHGIGH